MDKTSIQPETPPALSEASSRRVLEPVERVSEILFGVIMVLTFTGTFSVAEAGRTGVRGMMLSALGCNLAWGIIDGIMYLMARLAEKGRLLATLRAVRKSTDSQKALRLIASALPALIRPMVSAAELESIHQQLCQLPEPLARPRLRASDWVGGLGVFLLVFLSTFPIVLPFLFVQNARSALRVSNGVAILMLFITGYVFGRCTGFRPWLMGVAMVIVGLILVGTTILLGG